MNEHTLKTRELLASLQTTVSKHIVGAALKETVLPDCPSISLWLLDENYPQWRLDAEQAAAVMAEPPFWSFCWASGQILGNHLLHHQELVADKTIVDFGGGSGVVAIAAMLAGAKQAIVCDSDPAAREASLCNARLNNVELSTTESLDKLTEIDVITAADVFYDRDNLALLPILRAQCSHLLIADSRLHEGELSDMCKLGRWRSHTVPDLDESSEFRNVTIYQTEQDQQ